MILIINYGSQVTHLIGRRLRGLGVEATIKQPEQITDTDIQASKAIILSGGPESVSDQTILNKKIFSSGRPILGLCFGHQLIAREFGGNVEQGQTRQYGAAKLTVLDKADLFAGLDEEQMVWMSHGDSVSALPKQFRVIGRSEDCTHAAIAHTEKKIFGLQFHPEVEHTKNGTQILHNFVKIAGIKPTLTLQNRIQTIITDIQKKVGNASVIMGVSGGVDSLVASYLLHQAIGDRLFCVYVDTGLMRKDETEEVKRLYDTLQFAHFAVVDASVAFLTRLDSISDPEHKRKIIGHSFIEIFENTVAQYAQKNQTIQFLGQGTIYSDTVESSQATSSSAKIKSHHNLTLPDNMSLKVIEPLRDFYKDEVREIGKELGITQEYLNRHPFPGPGLAIRVVGALDKEKIAIVREADHIFITELKKANLYKDVWQALVALLPIKTVGVMGDARTYEYMITLRAVTSSDAMTADWAKLPNDFLQMVSNKIINSVSGVNRVVYDITQKPPGTIEYE